MNKTTILTLIIVTSIQVILFGALIFSFHCDENKDKEIKCYDEEHNEIIGLKCKQNQNNCLNDILSRPKGRSI